MYRHVSRRIARAGSRLLRPEEFAARGSSVENAKSLIPLAARESGLFELTRKLLTEINREGGFISAGKYLITRTRDKHNGLKKKYGRPSSTSPFPLAG